MDAKFITAKKESLEVVKDSIDRKKDFMDLELKIFKNDTERDIKSLQADIERNSGELWLLKGVESNALSSFIKTVTLQFELKQEAKYVLDDIIELLQKLEEIHESDYEKLEKLVEILKEKKKPYVDKIEPLFKNKPVYKFERTLSDLLGFPSRPSLFGGSRKIITQNKPK